MNALVNTPRVNAYSELHIDGDPLVDYFEGRGVILSPGFLPEIADVSPFGILNIRLERPDGSSLNNSDAEVAISLNLKNPRKPVLLKGVSKDDVPGGIEVW